MKQVKVIVFVDDIPCDGMEVNVADHQIQTLIDAVMNKVINYESTETKPKLELVH